MPPRQTQAIYLTCHTPTQPSQALHLISLRWMACVYLVTHLLNHLNLSHLNHLKLTEMLQLEMLEQIENVLVRDWSVKFKPCSTVYMQCEGAAACNDLDSRWNCTTVVLTG